MTSIWQWSDWIETPPEDARISLGEGNTPLVASRRLGASAGLRNLLFKLEISNPSGSYKDRFAVSAVSHMLARGKTRCIATSSGNTGAALAAYCAAAGVKCEIAVVETAPAGKLKQMMAYGAEIFRVKQFGLDADVTLGVVDCLARLGAQDDASLEISAFAYSPLGMSGVRSVAFELAAQSDEPIDHVFCPAGGGGLTLAVCQGFAILVEANRLERSPRVECVQPEGNNTMAGPLRDGAERAQAVACTSEVSGLQVASVIDGNEVIEACRANGGSGHLVDDTLTWETQARLARDEGIFCEPAGAIAVAAALDAARRGRIDPDARVVCLITGSAFKDPESIDRMLASPDCPIIELADLQRRAGN